MNENKIERIKELIELQNYEMAELICFQLIDEQQLFDGYNYLGQIFLKLELFQLAIHSFTKAVQSSAQPSAETLYSLACTYEKVGNKEKVIENLKLVLIADKTHWNAYTLLASILHSDKKEIEAIELLKQAINLKPDFALAHYWLGWCYMSLHETDKSIESFQIVIHLEPNNSGAYECLGLQKLYQNKPHEAIEYFDKHLSFNDSHTEYWNKAYTLLLLGNYKEGWKSQGNFTGAPDGMVREPLFRLWNGLDSLENKKVLVRAHYGYGDTFQLIRFMPRLKALGCSTTFECQDDLRRVLTHCPGIDQVFNRSDHIDLETFDYTISLFGLPGLLDVTLDDIPRPPYIYPNELFINHWKTKLQQYKNKTTVGLVWSAGEASMKQKNCHLSHFEELLNRKDMSFVSLQKGDKALQQINELGLQSKIVNLNNDIHNFEDTASIIMNLDLIISVDTSVAHLAGALNKPTFTLLPYAPDWRWMLDRSDSPWYPSMKLFRQLHFGDWTDAIEKLKAELKFKTSSK